MPQTRINVLRVVLVLSFAITLMMQVVILPFSATMRTVDDPELRPLERPLLTVSLVGVSGAQVILVSTWVLLAGARGTVFTRSGQRWVDVIVAALVAAAVLALGTSIWLRTSELGQASPSGALFIAAGLGSGVAALTVTVLKALLVQATDQRAELAEVV